MKQKKTTANSIADGYGYHDRYSIAPPLSRLNMSRHTQIFDRPLRLAVLSVGGLLLFSVGMWVSVSMPLLNYAWLSPVESEVSLQPYKSRLSGQMSYKLDLETGSLTFGKLPKRRMVGITEDKRLVVETEASYVLSNTDCIAYIMVFSGDDAGRELPFDFPYCPAMTVIDESLVAGVVDNQFTWTNPVENQPQSVAFSQVLQVIPIPGTRRFLLVHSGRSPATTGSAGTVSGPNAMAAGIPTNTAELCEINTDNQLVSIWSCPLHSARAVEVDGECVYLLKPNAKAIECRNATREDSEIKVLPLPEECLHEMEELAKSAQGMQAKIELARGVLSLTTQSSNFKYWRVSDLKPLALPNQELVWRRFPGNGNLIGYSTENAICEIVVHDTEVGMDKWTYNSGAELMDFAERADRRELHFATSQHGVTVDIVDLPSGKLLASHSPFAWFSWLLPTLMLGSVAWCLGVLHETRHAPWRWILAWLLPIPFMAVLFTHLVAWQVSVEATYVHQYLQAIFTGVLVCCSAWVVWGRNRFVVRLLPMAIVIAVLVGAVRRMLDEPWLEYEAVWTTLAVSSLPLIVFTLLRLCGVRLSQGDKASQGFQARGFPIRDLFLLCTAAAVLIAIAQPLLSFLSIPSSLPPMFMQAACAVAVMITGVTLVILAIVKRWTLSLNMLVIVLTVALAIEATYPFATGRDFAIRHDSFEMLLFRGVCCSLVVFSIVMQAIPWWAHSRLLDAQSSQ